MLQEEIEHYNLQKMGLKIKKKWGWRDSIKGRLLALLVANWDLILDTPHGPLRPLK